MQIIKSVITLPVFLYPLFIFAQTTYIPEGSKAYDLIDRLEIKQEQNTNLNFSTLKPYSRRAVVHEAEYIDSMNNVNAESLTGYSDENNAKTNLTPIDKYNIHSLLMDNSEWVTGSKESFLSNKSICNTFYTT